VDAAHNEGRLSVPFSTLFVLAAAAAQTATAAPPPVTRHWGKIFISPMGEPFRATATSQDPLAAWFAQADTDHDGYLSPDEMQHDAERFFATLDINHDGEIDPDELTRYEEHVAPEITGSQTAGWGENAAQENFPGASRYGLLDLPEPVISADTNFNRGVSMDEFRKAAVERFTALDVNHAGRLSLAGLENIRPAPAARPHTPTPQEGGPDPTAQDPG
jgi:Ca2+-binding EF-hand superfamily protein